MKPSPIATLFPLVVGVDMPMCPVPEVRPTMPPEPVDMTELWTPPAGIRRPEGPVEVVVSRVLSGIGYHQPPIYYVPSFTLRDTVGERTEPGGRFRLDHDALKERGELLAQRSDRQWRDAFRAGGYDEAVAGRFIRKLLSKIAGARAFGGGLATEH